MIDDQFAVMPIALAPAYFLAAPPLVAHRQAARANASAEPGPAPATRRRGKTGWRTTADGNAVYVLDMEPAAVARCRHRSARDPGAAPAAGAVTTKKSTLIMCVCGFFSVSGP